MAGRPVALVLLLVTWGLAQGVQQITNPRIIEHPEDQFVAKNEPATLNCKAEGDPPPIIMWYVNGRPVVTANENPQSHRMLLPSGQLFFLRIIHNKNAKPDVGVYYCNATNPETKVSVVSRNATLDIATIRDEFEEHPRNTEVAEGDTTLLSCRPPRGQPEPKVKWERDGQFIRPDSRTKIQDTGNLLIQNTKYSDAGIYVCIAHNIAGDKESSPARLMVREKPRIVKKPQDVTVEADGQVTFSCTAVGEPEPTIIWKREDGQVPHTRSEILTDMGLKISRVRVTDAGLYTCRAENSVGFQEAQARLSVNSKPSFLVTPRNKVVGVGRRVSFRCEVVGTPPPAVFWSKDPNQVLMFPRQDNGRFSVTDDGTLVIEPVRKEDAGDYMCQALSAAGSAMAKSTLEVKDVDPRPPPIIHQGPQNQTLPINSVAMLQCSATGDPPPTIRWYKDGRVLALRDPRFALLDSGTLQISDLRRSDTGLYTCKAMSETGETSWGAALVVEAPTDPTVIFHRTPEPSTFPGPPSKPTVTDVTETSMRLAWKANANHGASPVFAFTVEYFSHETGEGWLVATDTVTYQTYVVQGLMPGTAYMFLIRAQNSHGLSLPSQVTAPIRTSGSGVRVRPTVPQLDVSLVSEKLSGEIVTMNTPQVMSSTSIRIHWEVHKSQRYIEGFHIKYRVMPDIQDPADHGHHHHVEFTIETVPDAVATAYVLRNLRRYTWYEIRIQPFYLTVEGQESNTVRIRTYEDVPSAAPQNVRASLLDNTTLHLSWHPVPTEHRNGPMRGYKIYIFGNESKFNREIKVNESVLAIIVNHLVHGMAYRVQVAGFNRKGDGIKCDPILIGSDGSQGLAPGIWGEPWFIATLIGTIGGTLWFALCVFSIWLYRKRRAKKKMSKSGVVTVPVQKSEDINRLGSLFNTLSTPGYLQKAGTNGRGGGPPIQPDVTHIPGGGGVSQEGSKEALYNLPNVTQPGLKTFYNKAHAAPVAPYATTTLINANAVLGVMPPQAPGDSAFRPIKPGYVQQHPGNQSGSGDSCQKPLSEADMSHLDMMPAMYCEQCGMHLQDCECGNYTADEDTELLDPRGHPKGPVLFLPPPPEHPPPSDIGTPPDSPTPQRRGGGYHPHQPPYSEYAAAGHYSDAGGYHLASHMAPSQMQYPPGAMEGGGYHPSRTNPHHAYTQGRGGPQHPPQYQQHPQQQQQQQQRPPSPRFRTMSPRAHADSRAYSPRAMSEPERGPTPPVRAYKLVPIRDPADVHRHYSDTEGAPAPPLRMIVPHTPPSPAPEDPMMDRGIQSSLPSLANECVRGPGGGGGGGGGGGRGDSPTSVADAVEYVGDSDLETERHNAGSPSSSVGDVDTVTGSMLASWASVTDNSDNCSSAHISGGESSDGSFLAEADFASAVAKAAELSGLTVVGSTVTDPNAGREREKVKKPAKHRQRAKRPSSPYSTDSNYSAVPVPHRPYPKSERKRQLQEHGSRQRPPVRAKPHTGQGGDVPSYNRPNFPGGGASGSGTPLDGDQGSFRTNPMAAFDTRDTPIV